MNPEENMLPKTDSISESRRAYAFERSSVLRIEKMVSFISPENSASSSVLISSFINVPATFWQRRPVVDVFSGYCPNKAGSRMQAHPKTQTKKLGRENYLVRFDQKLTQPLALPF
jgi:hypothetical protein